MCPALIDTLRGCVEPFDEQVVKSWTTLFDIIAKLVEHYKGTVHKIPPRTT